MGMYTELHFNVKLKKDISENVINLLNYMIDNNSFDKSKLETPKHELFETKRWYWMFQSDSYYFSADTHSTLRYDDIGKSYYLCIRCNLKNYDSEIEKFIDWIDQYLDKYETFLGFYRYEENDMPILIFKK